MIKPNWMFVLSMLLFIPVVALAQAGELPPDFPSQLAVLLGLISPPVIQFLVKRIDSQTVRLVLAVIISIATALIAAVWQGLEFSGGIQFVIAVFSITQATFNTFWKPVVFPQVKAMQKIGVGCLLLFALAAGTTDAYAGDGTWTVNGKRDRLTQGEMLRFTATVDSVDTLTSNVFHLDKYDHVYWGKATDATTKEIFPFRIQYQASSAAGSPKLTAYVQASFDKANWFNADTVFADLTSETLTRADLDLNNVKAPYYRILLYGVALNRKDTVFDIDWWCYQEVY